MHLALKGFEGPSGPISGAPERGRDSYRVTQRGLVSGLRPLISALSFHREHTAFQGPKGRRTTTVTGVKSGTAFWKKYALSQALQCGVAFVDLPSSLCEISVKHGDYPPAVSISSNAQEMITFSFWRSVFQKLHFCFTDEDVVSI